MAKEDLIPFNQLTEEEQKELARKGGKASGKARRKKKALKEIAEMLGRTVAPDSILDDLRDKGLIGPDEKVTFDEAVMLAQYLKAARGNVQSALYLRDTSGQKPSDKIEIDDLTKETSKLDELLNQRKERYESE